MLSGINIFNNISGKIITLEVIKLDSTLVNYTFINASFTNIYTIDSNGGFIFLPNTILTP